MRRQRILLWVVILCVIAAIAFLSHPPRWVLNIIKPVDLSDPVATGAMLVERYECRNCHRVDGRGALLGPDLSGVTRRRDSASLWLWLGNPGAIRENTPMPNFYLSDGEIEAMIAYLGSIDSAGE